MTATDTLACRTAERRQRLFGNAAWNGIDYLDVADDQRSLCVHFFGSIPQGLGPDNFRIRGGRRIRTITVQAIALDPSHDDELDDCLRVMLDQPGDFSTYSLCLVDVPGIDPRFACLDFSFKVDCPSDLDCGDTASCPAVAHAEPDINYLAKDYASFRQLIYDRLALIMPDWRERHAADLGVTLVELLAYVGDYLSYYQDAVATEAYLGTARRRISVRRHLRLIDYAMHDGCNARAFVTIDTDADFVIDAGDVFFVTGVADIASDSGGFVHAGALSAAARQEYAVFEPIAPSGPLRFYAAHSSIALYDWGDGECCVAKGALHATLLDHDAEPDPNASPRLKLQPGDYLIFEEQRGALTGNPADADPAHRHVVRLTGVTPVYDALLAALAIEIEWAAEDALPFALCISTHQPSPDCGAVREVSVARGNVVLVDHGRTVSEPLAPPLGYDVADDCACDGSVVEVRRETLPDALPLEQAPLAFAAPVRPAAPAALVLAQDPRSALPIVSLDDGVGVWRPRRDLLASGADDRHFVAEIDDDGRADLRFGDGIHGRQRGSTAAVATYRTGGGTAGNVGREAIAHLVLRSGTIDGPKIRVRNPLPARGGTDPESMAEARLFAPGMIHDRRERAIVAEDYAELAQRDAPLQGAAARLDWTGSWYEARIAIDPLNREDCPPGLIRQIEGAIGQYRRIGHDVAVVVAQVVPLRLALHVCVTPHVSRSHVKAALLDLFSAGVRANGKTGFFHPDQWRFGQDVAPSAIVAAAMAIDGIETVQVTALQRLDHPDDGSALGTGRLAVRPGEIVRLDNDPDYPENGRLELDLGGGR